MKPLQPRASRADSKPSAELRAKPRAVAKRGRPVGDRQAKSSELIEAARFVIARDGYPGASLRKVAARAGYSTGAVTYYFANKEEMVATVTEALFDEFDGWLDNQPSSIDLRAIFDRMIVWTTSGRGDAWLVALQLLVRAATDRSLAAVIQKRYARFRRKLTTLIERWQSAGVVRSDIRAELLADQISAMADGWTMMFPVEPNRFSRGRINDLVNAAITMLSP
ncbi:TetR/AcrR family transcriptional regulator [Candidatus Binatus sp.]|uniref:TetR/AcrR family transcriptional regulator n=1 Tax=Candidatus Binatus sp. TaxID=2811406 RepID=UPI003CC69BFE